MVETGKPSLAARIAYGVGGAAGGMNGGGPVDVASKGGFGVSGGAALAGGKCHANSECKSRWNLLGV